MDPARIFTESLTPRPELENAVESREGCVTFTLHYPGQDDSQMTMARLALVQGVVTVLASGLGLLGVEAPDEMR